MPIGWPHLVVLLAIVALTIRLRPEPSSASASFEPLVVLAFFPLIVAVHELGHAVAAVLVGHRILEVRLGVGPGLTIPLGRGRLTFGLLPIGGYVMTGSLDPTAYRAKRSLVMAAGMTANAAVFVWTLLADDPSITQQMFALINVLVIVENILPYSLPTSYGPMRTDGLGFIRTMLDSEAQLAEERAMFAVTAAAVASQRSDWEEARRIADEAFARNPRSSVLRTWLGQTVGAAGDHAAARVIFRDLVDDDRRARLPVLASRDTVSRAVHLNDLAWTDLMLDDPALVDEALEASASALELLPEHPGIRATRAFALIAAGRPGEGIDLGRPAYGKTKEARARAMVASVLAIGYARDWRFQQADRWIAQARRWDADCPLVRRAESEVDARRSDGPGAVAESG